MALSGSGDYKTPSSTERNVKKIKELPLLLRGVLNKIGLDEDKGINEPQSSKQLPNEGTKPAIAWLVNAYETSLRSTEPTTRLFNTIPERINFINHIQELIDHGADPNQICAYHQPSFKKSDDDLTVTDVSPVIYAYHLLEEEQRFDKNCRVSETKENTQQVSIYLFDILKKCPALDINSYYYDQEGYADYVSPISVSAGCNYSNTAYDIKLIQALIENPELEFRGKNNGIYYQLVNDHHYDCLTLFNNHGTFSEETEHLKEIIYNVIDEDYDFDTAEYNKAFSLYFQTVPTFPFEKYGYQNIVNECEGLTKVSKKLATTLNYELRFHLVTHGITELLKEIKAAPSQVLKEQLLKTPLAVLNKMPSVTILDEIPDQAIHKTLSDSKFDLSKGLDVPQSIRFEGGRKVLTPLSYAVISKDKLLAATLMLSPKVQETEIADQAALKMAITQSALPIIHMMLIRLGTKLKNPQELLSYTMEAKNYAHPKNRCGAIRVLLESPLVGTHIPNDVLLNYLSIAAQQNDEGTATVLLRAIKSRIYTLLAEIENQIGVTSIIPNRDEWLKQVTQYCQEKIKHLNPHHFQYIVHWLYSLKLEHNVKPFVKGNDLDRIGLSKLLGEIIDLTRIDLNKLSDNFFKLARLKKQTNKIICYSLSISVIDAIKNILEEELNAQNIMRIMDCSVGCYKLIAETDPVEAVKYCDAISFSLQGCFSQYGNIINPKEITQFKEQGLVQLYKMPEKKEDFITACRRAAEEYKEPDPCKAATYLLLIQKSERSTHDYQNLFGCLQKIAKAYCTKTFNTLQGGTTCFLPAHQINVDELTKGYLAEAKYISPFERDTVLFYNVTMALINKGAVFSDPMKLNLVKYFIELAESYDSRETHVACFQGPNYYLASKLIRQINEGVAKFSELDQALMQMLLGVKGVANITEQFAPLFKTCITLLLDQGDQIKSSRYRVAASHYNSALALYFNSFKHSKGLIEVSRVEQIINDFFKNMISMDSFNRNDFAVIDDFISYQVKHLNSNQSLEKTVQFYLSAVKQFYGRKDLNQSETMTAFWYLRALLVLMHNPMFSQLATQAYQEIYDLTIFATESHRLIREWTSLWNVIEKYAQINLNRLNPSQRDIINQRCISFFNYAYGLSCFYKIPSQVKEAIESIKEAIKVTNTKKPEDFSNSMIYRMTLIDILCSDGQYEEAKNICLTGMGLINKNKLTKGVVAMLKSYKERLAIIERELTNAKPVKVEEVAEAKQPSPSTKKKKRKPKKKTNVLPEETPIENEAATSEKAPAETKDYIPLLQTYFNEIHSNLLKCRHDCKAIDDILAKFDKLDSDNTFRKKWSFVEEEKEKKFCKRTKLVSYKTISATDLSELKQLEDKVANENDKLNDKDIADAERLAKAFKDHLTKDEGTYSALLKDDQEFERIKQRPVKQKPKNPIAEKVERQREEKKALAKLEKKQKREQAEQRKQHALMWREAKAAEKIAREAEAKKKESQGDQKQENKQDQPPTSKKLSKRLLLEFVIKHLTFISATIGLHEIEQEEVSDLDLLQLETHYALLYDIFRCFAALRLYKQMDVRQTEGLNLDILVNLRNMIHHYGARLSIKGDTVLQTAKEFAQGLPALLKDIKKPYLMESALTVKQIKDMAQALNFIAKEDTRFELQPDMPLVIDNTDIYKTLTEIVDKHAETVGGGDKKQEQENELNQIVNLVSHLKMILQPVLEKHSEPRESLNEFYFRKFHAAKMIISHLGELGDPTTCQNYIDSALRHKSKAHGANLKKLTNIINFYQFLLKCRGLHNKVGHAFEKGADFDISMLYKVYRQACLIERPDLIFLQNKENLVGPSFFAASVYGMPQDLYAHRTLAPGDTKSS